MPSVSAQPSSAAGLNLVLFTIPQSFLLQVGTASIVLLLLAEKVTVETLHVFGEASEELFRGERLPILDFPDNDELRRS